MFVFSAFAAQRLALQARGYDASLLISLVMCFGFLASCTQRLMPNSYYNSRFFYSTSDLRSSIILSASRSYESDSSLNVAENLANPEFSNASAFPRHCAARSLSGFPVGSTQCTPLELNTSVRKPLRISLASLAFNAEAADRAIQNPWGSGGQ